MNAGYSEKSHSSGIVDSASMKKVTSSQDLPGGAANGKDGVVEEGDAWTIQLEPGDRDGPKLKKDMGWLSILAAGFNVNNSWLVVAATLVISLSYGPMNSIWGLLVTIPIYLCVALTLAELVAVYPTAGGQYHWTYIMAPEPIKKASAYFCGFVNWLSWVGMSSSSSSSFIFCTYALIMNAQPDFVPQGWHSFLIYEANVVVAFLANAFGKRILPAYYSSGFFLSVACFLVFTIVSLVMQKDKQSSKVVWTSYTELSGWPAGLQFLIALTAPVITLCPIDGAVHLVEEVNNATRVVPHTILSAIVISAVTALAFMLSTLYSVSDYDAVLASPSGFPLFEVWTQATSTTTVPVVFSYVTLYLMLIGTIACTQVASMLAFSLSRDKAIAFSQFIMRVDPRLDAPFWALLLNASIMFLIGILFLFSSVAYNSIVGVTVILQEITLSTPTVFLLYHRRSTHVLPENRPFKLSPVVGWTANIVTVLFAVLAVPIFLFPTTSQPSGTTMNYGVAVLAGALIIAVCNWFIYARKRFDSPLALHLAEAGISD